MARKGIWLFGAGGHAKSCIDVIEQHGQFSITGLVGTPDELGSLVLGYEVNATDENLAGMAQKAANALVAVGQIESARLRIDLFTLAEKAGFSLPIIVSPGAYVSPHANIGAGSIVMPGATVNAGAVIGKNCIINTGAIIEHDAAVDDHCHISTGAVINGNVRIGSGSFIGSGAVVREGLCLGQQVFIGMSTRVLENLPDGTRQTGRN